MYKTYYAVSFFFCSFWSPTYIKKNIQHRLLNLRFFQWNMRNDYALINGSSPVMVTTLRGSPAEAEVQPVEKLGTYVVCMLDERNAMNCDILWQMFVKNHEFQDMSETGLIFMGWTSRQFLHNKEMWELCRPCCARGRIRISSEAPRDRMWCNGPAFQRGEAFGVL